MWSWDTGESQSLLQSAPGKQTKTQGWGGRSQPPGPEAPGHRGRSRAHGEGCVGCEIVPRPRRLDLGRAPPPRGPGRGGPRRGADYKSQEAQRRARAEPGAIPRDPARREAPRRTQRRRPEGGERAGGRGAGGGGADVGRSPACRGGGRPGRRRAALGAGSAACAAPAARSRLGWRRTAGAARGPRRAGQRSTQSADPRRGRAPRAARPLPGGRPLAPALGARRLPGFNGCSAGQRLGVEGAEAQEGARASLLRGRPRLPRRAPWGPADPGRRGPLARRLRVPAMN